MHVTHLGPRRLPATTPSPLLSHLQSTRASAPQHIHLQRSLPVVRAGPGDKEGKPEERKNEDSSKSSSSSGPSDDELQFMSTRANEFAPKGNLPLQDALAEMVQFEVKKEAINETTREEEQKLKDAADLVSLQISFLRIFSSTNRGGSPYSPCTVTPDILSAHLWMQKYNPSKVSFFLPELVENYRPKWRSICTGLRCRYVCCIL